MIRPEHTNNEIRKPVPKTSVVSRRQRENAERSALKSALHLRLPRPTVVKTTSPMTDLMWDVPSWTARNRRKSHSAITEHPSLGSSLEDEKSYSQPVFKLGNANVSRKNTDSSLHSVR